MSTRVGKYIFDIDLDDMSIEKLEFLKSGCDCFIKQKKADKWMKEFFSMNLQAHTDGFHLCYVDEKTKQMIPLNCYNFKAIPREEIDKDDY